LLTERATVNAFSDYCT